jgi:peptidoglycan hydrolase-like protein with peptidoglycan-binding domain
MARSARRPEPVRRRAGLLQSGAAALGGFLGRNPVLVGGSTAFLVTLFYVSANALWYQPFAHRGAFFATRSMPGFPQPAAQPETTINIERPAAAPAPVKGDPVVQQVQSILKDLDFYSGTVDGISGPGTHKAIEAYQKKVGLTASGEIDALLLDQLGANPTTASVPVPTPRVPAAAGPAKPALPAPASAARPGPAAPPAAGKPAPVVPASLGAADAARIVKIQAGLKAFGNADMQLDGKVGPRTKSAIKEFQSLFGLPPTGDPDEATYAKMRAVGLTN